MEQSFLSSLFDDKQIVNPMNPEEVFTCTDLFEDYKICRKEKRMETTKIGKKMDCTEYRWLGKFAVTSLLTLLASCFSQQTSVTTTTRVNSSITSCRNTKRRRDMQTSSRMRALSWRRTREPTRVSSA